MPLARGLSTRLLILTILFVMIAEVLIFLPSVANFRERWLQERLASAAAASLVLAEAGDVELPKQVRDDVLMAIGAKAVAIREAGVSRLLVMSDMPISVDEQIDIDAAEPMTSIGMALYTLFAGGDKILRVFGSVGDSDKVFELIVADASLRDAMLVYSRNVALLSLIISLITATLVFYSINRFMIRPIRAMTRAMLTFREAPDDPARVIAPSGRHDELGVAERELAAMQAQLHKTLGEQKHLADLGLAVSKINHDMRNILASAQLMSDRLAVVKDPSVQSFAPKLIRTLDRAVSYAEGVLAYGRTQEAPPSRRRLRVARLVDEVHDILGLGAEGGIEFVNTVEPDFEIDADSDQLFRVLHNLCRNAVQAMTADDGEAVIRRLTVSAGREGSVARLTIEDTGPGLPPKARENLFAAFRGSARSGGTGLGLAIASELVRAHGGTLELVESAGGKTVFAITIPDRPVILDEARTALRREA
ncbi:MAG: HAMP domain-containing sensor histidine kinase [Rhizobiaceae bacterium]